MKTIPSFTQLGRASGFGLVELLVGMAIGLITVVVIMQVLAVSEGYKRTTTTGVDAQTNGTLALRTLEGEIRQAGYGMTNGGANLCPTINKYYNGTATIGIAAQIPVTITDGGTGSDMLDIVYSSSDYGSAPMAITTAMPTPANVTRVNSCVGLSECGFVMYASRDGSKACTIAQVTDNTSALDSSCKQFHTGSGTSLYNPPGGFNAALFPAGGYNTNDIIINAGAMISRRYFVQKTASADEYFLRRTNLNAADDGCTGPDPNPNLDVISNIVNIQAQYGVAASASQTVDCWTNAVDQTGNANVPSHCRVNWTAASLTTTDAKRIKAVRVAIVARSALSERPPTAGATCNTTMVAPTAWYAPTTSNPAPTIDLTSVPNWQCYRYKVYQSVIPLINVIWSNT